MTMEPIKCVLIIWHIVNIVHAVRWYDDFYVRHDAKRSSVCKTIGGNVPNADCILPFQWKHATYRTCTKAHSTKLWCATELGSDRQMKHGKWGYCDPKCSKITLKPEILTPCSDGSLCALIPVSGCADDKVKSECPKKCGNCNSPSVKAPSLSEYTRAKSFLRDVMIGDNIPAAVRLAFHDCVGPNGCDGCINPNKNSNFGLQSIIKLLVAKRNEKFPTISNADFWQIAGIAALENANPRVRLTFNGGRRDCPTSPKHDAINDFPDPVMTRSQMMGWYKNSESGFGMTERQVTALMGAHSLGRARRENSGYRFSWTATKEHVFDNEFYQLIRNFAPLYNNENQTDSGEDLKYQWVLKLEGGQKCMLLNTDMELSYDIDVDNAGFGTQCLIPFGSKTASSRRECREASTKQLVDLYAKNEQVFLDDFKEAYEIMMTAKIPNLEIPN